MQLRLEGFGGQEFSQVISNGQVPVQGASAREPAAAKTFF